jgi:hypothetical protein
MIQQSRVTEEVPVAFDEEAGAQVDRSKVEAEEPVASA